MENDISSLLQQIKAQTGWSETLIAKKIMTSQPTVNRILNGQNECKASTYKSIHKLYGEAVVSDVSHNSHKHMQ